MRNWNGYEVTLKELLEAKEEREWEQGRMIRKYGCPLVCFRLNARGPVKISPDLERAYRAGVAHIRSSLSERGLEPVKDHELYRRTGYAYLAAVQTDALALKRLMINVEAYEERSGLYEIEVLGTDGKKISAAEATANRKLLPAQGMSVKTCCAAG